MFHDDNHEIIAFNSTEFLLNIDFVKKVADIPNFYRYSIFKQSTQILLIYELNEGYEWYALGYLTLFDNTIDLPLWSSKYKKNV